MIMVLNLEEIINFEKMNEHKEELEKWTEYIPLELLGFINTQEYFRRWTDEAKIKYQKTRQQIPADRIEEYLKKDIYDWVEEYPQFQDILL